MLDCFVVYLINFFISYNIKVYSRDISLLKLAKIGFKLSDELLLFFDSLDLSNGSVTCNSNKKYVKIIKSFIPFINVIDSVYDLFVNTVFMGDDGLFKKSAIPMSKSELNEYRKIIGITDKLNYLHELEVSENEIVNKLSLNIGVNGLYYTNGIYCKLYSDSLKNGGYTLSEVKILNEECGHNYQLGTMNGIDTAIIGVPDCVGIINLLNLDPSDITVMRFDKLLDSDCNNKIFVVYPFNVGCDVLSKLEDKSDNLLKSSVDHSSELTNIQNICNCMYSSEDLTECNKLYKVRKK